MKAEQWPLFSVGYHDCIWCWTDAKASSRSQLVLILLFHIQLITLTADPLEQEKPPTPNQKVDSELTEAVGRQSGQFSLDLATHPLSIWYHHFPESSDLSTSDRQGRHSEPLTPLLDLHPPSSCHIFLRSNSWNKSLRLVILLVALLP